MLSLLANKSPQDPLTIRTQLCRWMEKSAESHSRLSNHLENWFEDLGSAHLVKGTAVIQLDPDFIQTVNTEREYDVFLTPYGDCKGLYVTNRTVRSFEVHELGGGVANVGFGYRVIAIRRKYETVRFEDHTKDPDPRKMLRSFAKPSRNG